MLPPFLLAALFLGGTATAVPASSSEVECTPRTLCVDGINTCGVRFGGCYDVCKPESKPIAPLCVVTSATPAPPATSVAATSTADATTPTNTTVIKSTRTRHRPSSRTRRPRPTRQQPSGTVVAVTSVPVPTPPAITTSPLTSVTCPDGKLGSGQTLCMDMFDKCGQTYGGCFQDCKPWPTFTPRSPCPDNTTSSAVTTSAIPTWGL
ncbi:hypothetical protein QBC47DRAFT_446768 [Echria macrotheca]|uniref:Uncharacterized protein n=1 Tax=Echria macrotheca TaxID=438768 RepID=A0AAJ0BBL7_9PEZI|nr:hypothetical protein QBC47DRAFT_446768 [Echria macrotheca]